MLQKQKEPSLFLNLILFVFLNLMTLPFAERFDFDTKNTGVVKKFFYYNEETPETETLDNVVDFIKSLT